MNTKKKTGVLLLNLGGPNTQQDVEPFLYNLFSDRQIIRLGPSFLQKPIARFIAWRRAPKSKECYQKIGGGSPINRITASQALALEKSLGEYNFPVRTCMRYWSPFSHQVVGEFAAKSIKNIIALPLYPHYSIATTGSSFSDLEKSISRIDPSISIQKIQSWPVQTSYIACLAQKIREGVSMFPPDQHIRIVYSAHSLPKSFIDEGDPYVAHLKKSISALETITGHQGVLCYQSRSGPVEWLEPSTPDMLKELSSLGCKNILMVPLSFVSDHVETLYEINMLYKEMAKNLGMKLECTQALNKDPLFIDALKSLVLEKYQELAH